MGFLMPRRLAFAFQFWFAVVLASACNRSAQTSLAAWCSEEKSCQDHDAARKLLMQATGEPDAPRNREAGSCGHFRYLRHQENRVPTDLQSNVIVVRYYGQDGRLVGVREAQNLDSSGTYSAVFDHGAIPACVHLPNDEFPAVKRTSTRLP